MRKFMALALASTFFTATPVVVQPVEAASLFEKLFPRAAERRRQRRDLKRRRQFEELERQRRARNKRLAVSVGKAKISKPKLKNYSARKLSSVRLGKLAKAFRAYDAKLLEDATTTAAIEQPEPKIVNPLVSNPLAVTPQLISEVSVVDGDGKNALAPVRLSAGAGLLKSIALKSRPTLGKAVVSFYKENPKFIWVDENGDPNDKANTILKVLADAEAYGLRAEDYQLAEVQIFTADFEEDKLRTAMQFEFSLTAAALRYMSDARHGVVDPNRISGYHDFSGLNADYLNSIKKLAKAADPDEMLVSQHPQDQAFGNFKHELAKLRDEADGFDSVSIENGTFLKPGQTSDQLENIVESIRRKASSELLSDHFDVFSVEHSDGEYTGDVVAMIKDFQRSKNLSPDGIIGKNTIARMGSDDPKVQMNKVLYAMERLRWQPDRLGNTHVFINQPAFRATYIKNGKAALSMRAVVGKPSNQTNFFHDKIEYVEYNPYWGIPRSILVNEMLPKLRRNSSYFDNIGYEVTNIRGQRISSRDVDWYGVGAEFPYNVRQPPGRKNALGELKIMFPNKHSIYMHDTPAKSLFKRDKRAFSHGCVRLAEPRRMAAAVLGTSVNHVGDRLFDGENKQQRLEKPIPVYIAYFTAWPDKSGDVKYFGDVYGRDKALSKAMAKEAKERGA